MFHNVHECPWHAAFLVNPKIPFAVDKQAHGTSQCRTRKPCRASASNYGYENRVLSTLERVMLSSKYSLRLRAFGLRIARSRFMSMQLSTPDGAKAVHEHSRGSQIGSNAKGFMGPDCAGGAANPPMTQSERMRARWQDPAWRAAMLAKRSTTESVRKRSESLKKHWQDPAFRARMRSARLGRAAWNLGVSPSAVTRARMSFARKGLKKSEQTRKRMSEGKLRRSENDNWPKLISESKRGKTKQYFQMRREFRALREDLRLWSQGFRAHHGRLPKASNIDRFIIAPMMAIKIKRYVILKRIGGFASTETDKEEIIIDDEAKTDEHQV